VVPATPRQRLGPPNYPSAGEPHRDADQDESDEGGPNSDRTVAGEGGGATGDDARTPTTGDNR